MTQIVEPMLAGSERTPNRVRLTRKHVQVLQDAGVLTGRRLLVRRQPSAEGYGEITIYGERESAATLARPDAPVRVSDLLPPVLEA